MKEKMKKASVTESEYDKLLRGGAADEDDKRKRAAVCGGGSGGASSTKSCQAEKCAADLSDAKTYHRRHKVCEHHAKAQVVVVGGIRQRFCQQCSRFHDLPEFDEAKRSCRRRLAGHNERRRKNSTTDNSQADHHGGSTSSTSRIDDRGKIQITTVQENANYKRFHAR